MSWTFHRGLARCPFRTHLFGTMAGRPRKEGAVHAAFVHATLAVWQRLAPPRRRPPLLRVALVTIAENLVVNHKAADALCCILIFEAYARPAEAMALTGECITAPVQGAGETLAATSLLVRSRDLGAPSKMELFNMSVALGLPRQASVGSGLSRLAASIPPGARFWEFDHTASGVPSPPRPGPPACLLCSCASTA